MSQRNLEVVRSLDDAFESRDFEEVLSLLDEGVVAQVGDDLPWSGTYHRPEGFRELIEKLETYVHVSFETGE